ncbi:dephospho-CoA kinase [Desulfovibrio sp. ZJ369]|uniref:dephospho-CoA kinase n=1 Tax=Desulfovibrio sp. ZJ369 TaxID=2709793 RepID=UPI0013EBDCF3|nr:dephospho-CoA kinase [Desulfovibrio sp. ZJ369]
MSDIDILITAQNAGQRLDRVLRDAAPALSRSALQKAVLAGHCLADGLPLLRPDARTRLGQRLVLRLPEAKSTLQAEDGELELLWQDEHLVVCNKPAGLTVHPCPSCPERTLVQRLLGRFPQLAKLEGLRPGIVHRLDKDTSGLLLVALDEPARLALSASFARREVSKEYLALVSGLPPATGECREPLGRHPTAKIKMAVLPEARGGKPAHSQWTRLWSAPDQAVSLLAVRIHTGRTHQIRVHLAHLGYPLLGDRLYAPKEIQAKAPRQMLHAWRLAFRHPGTGEELRFNCPPPGDLPAAALAACRRTQRVVITGNPGSGKSALTKELSLLGVPVLSADAVVAALYAPRGEAADWIGRRWGTDLLAADGGVDKTALLSAMRGNADLRREVENMVHALVREALEAFWKKQEALGAPLAVAEVPLYFECGWQNIFSPRPLSVGVHCPLPLRIGRIMAGRGWSEEKAAALEAWQWPEARKQAACDLLVDNSGPQTALEAAARRLLETLEERRRREEEKQEKTLQRLWS